MSVLARNNCAYVLDILNDNNPYVTAMEMPDDVLQEMLRQIGKDRQDTRDALTHDFAEAKPMVLRRIEEAEQFRGKELFDDYCMKRIDIADMLKNLGAINSAWHVLYDIGLDVRTKITNSKRIFHAVRLAELLSKDNRDRLGLHRLQECVPIAETLVASDPLWIHFWRAYANALAMSCLYSDAVRALQHLSDHGTSEERIEACACAAELHFLQGNLLSSVEETRRREP